MPREIEFRGSCIGITTPNWAYGYYVYDITHRIYVPKANLFYDVRPETLGQYTGLLDKNGKKIFEGDILRGYGSHPLTVIFGKYGWCVKFKDFDEEYIEPFDDDLFENYGPEVIGNIYENLEVRECH